MFTCSLIFICYILLFISFLFNLPFLVSSYAKERRLRLWRNYIAGPTVDRNAFTARVIDIGLADSIVVKKENGEESKIYFSSFRPPRFF